MNLSYCKSLTHYSRRQASEVRIGPLPMGGDYPVRVQTMTNTRTSDTKSTVKQIISAFRAGAEYVRITVPSKSDADNLKNIVNELRNKNCMIPVIADIHFNPDVAILAAKMVEKVRINPGNFADRKSFRNIEYTDKQYQDELKRIEDKFVPLIEVCKQHKTALRIGTNHGSLSDRIMSRYGDTPEGMAESAMEFLRICRKEDFEDIVVSMKASNPLIMVQATRLLMVKMDQENMHYPVHLGVTEAGDGEDGRIKSAVGIGALLADGIGDTIRVSLTEDPEKEIPVAQKLVRYITERAQLPEVEDIKEPFYNPYEYLRRKSDSVLKTGGGNPPVVCVFKEKITTDYLEEIGWQNNPSCWQFSDQSPEFIISDNSFALKDLPETRGIVIPFLIWKDLKSVHGHYPLFDLNEYINEKIQHSGKKFVMASYNEVTDEFIQRMKNDPNVIFILKTFTENRIAEERFVFYKLIKNKCTVPVVLYCRYNDKDQEYFQLKSAIDTGTLLLDGFGDGIMLYNEYSETKVILQTSFTVLQAVRTRISKPEYISCPSCGRTMFDIQKTTARIRERTSHLKGLKIGIMGCIVNGLGEMADADYGYIGMGNGKISLYKEKIQVKKNIPEKDAVDELIQLIKNNGDWTDPPVS